MVEGNKAGKLQTAGSTRRAHIDAAIVAASSLYTVITVGLDNLATIESLYDADTADAAIRTAATRLRAVVGPADSVHEIGTELVVVAPGGWRCDDLAELALEAFATPIGVGAGRSLYLDASVGVSHSRSSRCFADALEQSKLALAEARTRGGQCHVTATPELVEACREQRTLLAEIERGVGAQEFSLHYQPIVASNGGRPVVAREALLRWHHPRRGLLPAAHFIELAERSRLIGSIGRHTLDAACADAAQWADEAAVAVNVTVHELTDSGFAERVRRALRRGHLAPERLIIEIVEREAVAHRSDVVERLNSLRRLGIRVALDDFLTRYAALDQLTAIPADILKISSSLTQPLNVARPAPEAALIIGLAEQHQLQVIAEGIETESAACSAADLGAHMLQGFHFGAAAPPGCTASITPGEQDARPPG